MQTTADISPANPESSITGSLSFSNPAVLELIEVTTAKKPWTLTLHPEHLALSDTPGGQPYIILRQNFLQSVSLAAGTQILSLRTPIKTTFKLSKEGGAALADWIGKPTLASYLLKQRNSYLFPLAILILVGSLPLPGGTGAAALPFNPLGLGLGIGLGISWAFAKWRPHPVLFLVDSIWLTVYSAQLVLRVVNGGGKFALIFLPLLFWMILKGLSHFSQFRHTRLR